MDTNPLTAIQTKPLPNMSLDSNGQGAIAIFGKAPCTNCTILSGRIFLDAYDIKTKAKLGNNPIYLYHFVTANRGKQVFNPIQGCSSAYTNAFIDAGEDSGETDTIFASKDRSINSGFWVRKENPDFGINYDVVNSLNQSVDLFLTMQVEWLPGLVGVDAGHDLKVVSRPSFSTPAKPRN
jgi:hypothetical protein